MINTNPIRTHVSNETILPYYLYNFYNLILSLYYTKIFAIFHLKIYTIVFQNGSEDNGFKNN